MIYTFFAIIENGHIAADQVNFLKCNIKKTANFTVCGHGAIVAKFIFFNHGDLNNIFIYLKNTFFLCTSENKKFEIP